MYIYLPLAEMPINVIVILLVGILSGMLSGIFGIGGGFITTPCLMFLGIPPTVAVSSSANQIIAASFSGFLTHFKKSNVDIKIAMVIIAGSMFGSSIGVWIFKILNKFGQIDLVISVTYMTVLSSIGMIMLLESMYAIITKNKNIAKKPKLKKKKKINLPFEIEFPHSNIKISALLPLSLGVFTGILVSIMGIGGGFIMIPAMIYLLKMPTSIAIGTSLLQIMFTAANVTILQAITNNTVDIVLALLMISGSVFGAQIGTRVGIKIPAEYLRISLSIIVLLVSIKLSLTLFITPKDLYTITLLK